MLNKRTTYIFLSIFSLVSVLALAFPPAARAFEGRTGDEVLVPEGETINDDLYASGRRVVIDGTVNGDLVVFAREVIVNGTVTGDLLGGAQLIQVNGTIEDDVRAAAYTIELMPGSKVGSDFIGAAYNLNAHKGSSIAETLVFGGRQGLLSGKVGKDVKLAAEGLEISGPIGGNVVLELGSKQDRSDFHPGHFFTDMPVVPSVEPGLKMSSSAEIGGNLTYTAKETSSIPDGVVAGETTHLLPKLDTDRPDKPIKASPASMVMAWALGSMRFFISLLIVGLLAVWLIPSWITRSANTFVAAPAQSLGWGVVTFVAYWFALSIAFSIVLLCGVILAVLTLGDLAISVFLFGMAVLSSSLVIFMLAASYFSIVVLCYWIGKEILTRFQPASSDKLIWAVVTGIVLAGIICAVPVLGWLVRLVASFMGLGALFMLVRAQLRKTKPAEIEAAPVEPAA